MNIVYKTLEQIQANKWYAVSPEMEIAKGKYKIKSFKEKLDKIKRGFLYFLLHKNKH